MTDRRASHFLARVRRGTIGRVWPVIRHLRARGIWAWWTATGVIPRWQLLLVYVLVIVAGAYGLTSTRDVADRADHAAVDAKHAAARSNEAATQASRAADDNCSRIHRLVRTLDQVMASGEAQVRRYVSEGLLTPEQGVRADRERVKQQLVLRGADCPTP